VSSFHTTNYEGFSRASKSECGNCTYFRSKISVCYTSQHSSQFLTCPSPCDDVSSCWSAHVLHTTPMKWPHFGHLLLLFAEAFFLFQGGGRSLRFTMIFRFWDCQTIRHTVHKSLPQWNRKVVWYGVTLLETMLGFTKTSLTRKG
jgi:hypothetical protein